MKYPTKEEILDPRLTEETNLPDHFYRTIANWKKDFWLPRRKTNNDWKNDAVADLLHMLNDEDCNPPLKIITGKKYCYIPKERAIVFGPEPSIISALHELGHHLFGKSELKACRFSIHLFKYAFPKSFAKLKWKNHMLIKKENICPKQKKNEIGSALPAPKK